MLMGRVDGGYWTGGTVHISFNPHRDLGAGANSQDWTTPELLLEAEHTLWYPSLQPLSTDDDVTSRATSVRLGKRARLFVKHLVPVDDWYGSEHIVEFER